MSKIILKVQLPIASNDPDVGILVYNEDRSIMTELPMRTKAELKKLQKEMKKGECGEIYDGFKNYFYAKKSGKTLVLLGLAPMQDW